METTRITESSSSCIDLLFTDMLNIMDSGVLNYNISDHLPIYLIKKKSRNRIIKVNVVGRSYLHYDSELFNRTLRACDWSKFDSTAEPEGLWHIFESNIREALDGMSH